MALRSKESVDYSLGGDHCHACEFFIEESEAQESGRCTKVAGKIDGHYWCKLFKRAAGHGTHGGKSDPMRASTRLKDM